MPDATSLVRIDTTRGTRRTLLSSFANHPIGLVEGPDGALYTSNVAISAEGGGGVLRIDLWLDGVHR